MVATLTAVISYTEKADQFFNLSLNCQEAFKSLWHSKMQY